VSRKERGKRDGKSSRSRTLPRGAAAASADSAASSNTPTTTDADRSESSSASDEESGGGAADDVDKDKATEEDTWRMLIAAEKEKQLRRERARAVSDVYSRSDCVLCTMLRCMRTQARRQGAADDASDSESGSDSDDANTGTTGTTGTAAITNSSSSDRKKDGNRRRGAHRPKPTAAAPSVRAQSRSNVNRDATRQIFDTVFSVVESNSGTPGEMCSSITCSDEPLHAVASPRLTGSPRLAALGFVEEMPDTATSAVMTTTGGAGAITTATAGDDDRVRGVSFNVPADGGAPSPQVRDVCDIVCMRT
jgi:hypothetical protein